MLEEPVSRAALRELGFAAVWLAPSIDRMFAAEDGLAASVDRMLRDLAVGSGYAGLALAPVVLGEFERVDEGAVAPAIPSAEPVERTFLVTRLRIRNRTDSPVRSTGAPRPAPGGKARRP
jgi:hypothetical protein